MGLLSMQRLLRSGVVCSAFEMLPHSKLIFMRSTDRLRSSIVFCFLQHSPTALSLVACNALDSHTMRECSDLTCRLAARR